MDKKQLVQLIGRNSAKPKGFGQALWKACDEIRADSIGHLVPELRDRFNDEAALHIERELVRRYSKTHEHRPRVNAGTVKQVAYKDARTYAGNTPLRRLDFGLEKGAKLSSEQERAQTEFDETLEGVGMEVLRDFDRRRKATEDVWGKVDYDSTEDRVRLVPYWTSQVWALTHHRYGSNKAGLMVVMVEAAAPFDALTVNADGAESRDGKTERFFEVWHRSYRETSEGFEFGVWDGATFKPGRWVVELVGQATPPKPLYPNGLYPLEGVDPWFSIPNGDCDGHLIKPPGDSLLLYARNQDVLQSDMLHAVAANGSPGVFVIGAPSLAGKEIPFRMGEITPVADPGASVVTVPLDLSTVGIEVGRDQSQRLAINRRANRGAYDATKGTAESGAARDRENMDEVIAAAEDAETFKAFEEQVLLPKIAAVSDGFRGTNIMKGEPTFTVQLAAQSTFETPRELLDRLIVMKLEGLITNEQILVELSRANTLEEARELLAEIAEQDKGFVDEEFTGKLKASFERIDDKAQTPDRAKAKEELKKAAKPK